MRNLYRAFVAIGITIISAALLLVIGYIGSRYPLVIFGPLTLGILCTVIYIIYAELE